MIVFLLGEFARGETIQPENMRMIAGGKKKETQTKKT